MGALLTSPVGRFRAVAFLEGLSLLLLFFVAMPLKYALGLPQAVSVVGMAHGLLFLAYLVALSLAAAEAGWGLGRVALAFVASLVPFGTFWFDAQLRREG